MKLLLCEMIKHEASDLHIKVDRPPIFRIQGSLIETNIPSLKHEEILGLLDEIMNAQQKEHFFKTKEADFAFALEGAGRFRTNVFYQRGKISIAIRYVKSRIPSFDELGLPPSIREIANVKSGIIVISGATGNGKSTTQAAILDYINTVNSRHIVTIEDPIEYVHRDKKSVINQREVGIDTESFQVALKHVLRQDPDIIMIGEMRDASSFTAAVAAAETGHLVMTTLHIDNASQCISRIMEFFPTENRDNVRMQLASTLEAVVCQRLLPRASGVGMIPAVEIMLGSPSVRKLIRENKLAKLGDAIETSRDLGMQAFNQSLVEMVQKNLITEDVALKASNNPEALKMNLKGIFLDESRRILGD
ncbi:MAG: PilT/PilU family type 4a pilus ATPase [Candidatus Auribacter fodinae]|uniref:PilT/PilU family type 4a pilus ATPase n=1 Tax=Candidatus Auribacter fodinae TaxID=2093366 RepID=A0A3A4R4Y3_9BACT|nr:MAG: PilT/PilU family type 4a pilus ATPase [Candidatus Auribacter fodinae]